MEEERKKIVGGVEALYQVCLKPDESATPKSAVGGIAESFNQNAWEIHQILDKSEREFKVKTKGWLIASFFVEIPNLFVILSFQHFRRF